MGRGQGFPDTDVRDFLTLRRVSVRVFLTLSVRVSVRESGTLRVLSVRSFRTLRRCVSVRNFLTLRLGELGDLVLGRTVPLAGRQSFERVLGDERLDYGVQLCAAELGAAENLGPLDAVPRDAG